MHHLLSATDSRTRARRPRPRRAAALGLLAAAAAFAATVASAPPASATSNIDQDRVQLVEHGVDFGNIPFADGAPTGHGTLTWVLREGELTPRLRGTLHLKNVEGLRVRMAMDFYNGNNLLSRKSGGTVIAPDNGHHAYRVDLRPYSDNRITKVIVKIESWTPIPGGWRPAVSDTFYRTLTDDEIRINRDGFSVGDDTFVDDAPGGPATVDWDFASGALTAHVRGTLHIVHNAGACARIVVRPFTGDRTGREGRETTPMQVGGLLCAPDNGHTQLPFDISLPPTADPIEAVNVVIRVLNPNPSEVRSRFAYVSQAF